MCQRKMAAAEHRLSPRLRCSSDLFAGLQGGKEAFDAVKHCHQQLIHLDITSITLMITQFERNLHYLGRKKRHRVTSKAAVELNECKCVPSEHAYDVIAPRRTSDSLKSDGLPSKESPTPCTYQSPNIVLTSLMCAGHLPLSWQAPGRLIRLLHAQVLRARLTANGSSVAMGAAATLAGGKVVPCRRRRRERHSELRPWPCSTRPAFRSRDVLHACAGVRLLCAPRRRQLWRMTRVRAGRQRDQQSTVLCCRHDCRRRR